MQKVKNCQRGPAAMMRGSNMGIPPYWPNILLITWGLLLHKAGYLFFYIMCGYTECSKAASGLPLELAFQKHHVISLGGLVMSEPMQRLLIGESHQITWGHGQV